LIVILFAAIKKSWARYRIQAAFILFSFLLGPGLIVNTLFKDNWGRPRPVHIEQFNGAEQYVPPLKYNALGDGKSFPSGHSSLGFGFIAFWFLWRKRKPLWAKSALGFSLLLGSLFGIARMSAGGHFLSDVFWSLWVPLLSSMALYYLFFQKSLDDGLQQPRQSIWKNILYSFISLMVLSYGLFNWPIKQDKQLQFPISPKISFMAKKTNLQIRYAKTNTKKITIHHQVDGFGLPFSRQIISTDVVQGKYGAITQINLQTQGVFSELKSKVTIKIPSNYPVKNISIQIKNGKVIASPVL